MHSARVITNETCNQRCAFCNARRPSERASVASPSSVAARIDEAIAAGAHEVVLTGGEPSLRRDLPAVVAYARRSGAEQVTLETNGSQLDEARALALARAGLTLARVHLPIWGDACDQVTGEVGGFARTLAAMHALAAAGIALEIAAPVVRANVAHLPQLPVGIAASGLPVKALVLGVPSSSPDERQLLPQREAAAAIGVTFGAARQRALTVRIDPSGFLPPCLFEKPSRVAGLYSLTRGGGERRGFTHPGGCDGCSVRDRCPGISSAALSREQGLEPRPISDDKTRRRLSLVSTVEAQIARELVTRDVRRRPGNQLVRELIVRINFQCNQACRFCFVSTHLPGAEHEAIERAIAEIARDRGLLSISGGEPTLNPRLLHYVTLARSLGVSEIELQTNATRLGDGDLASALVDAGVGCFLVSLHASTAAVSDAITEAPGTFDQTVRGIDRIAQTSALLKLNFVFCEKNQADFPDYVRMVAARWPRAEISVSFVASSTDVVPLERALIPRYEAVLPHMAEGIREAKRLGVTLTGFETMCGVPLCLLPDDLRPYAELADIPEGHDRDEFVRAESCARCALSTRCFGVRRGYASLYGTDELRAVTARELER